MLSSILETIEGLQDWQKYGAVGLIVVIILISFWYFVRSPKMQEIEKLNGQIRKLDAQINQGLAMKDKRQDLEKEVAILNDQLKKTLDILPDRTAMDQFVKSIESLAVESGLTVLRFNPKPVRKLDFYGEMPIDIGLSGTYHELGTFFEKLANETRIVNFYLLDLRSSLGKGDATIQVSLGTLTYWFLKEI